TRKGNDAVLPLSIGSGIQRVINGLTITGGRGGGLMNSGEMTLNDVVIRANKTVFDLGVFPGGALLNFGTLTIHRGVISNNVAQDSGGGIFNGGTLTLYYSSIFGNQAGGRGGGIFNTGVITLISSTISSNRVTGSDGDGGGAISNL